jgi:hypothetical protein
MSRLVDLLKASKHAAANCQITLILEIVTRACRCCFICSCASIQKIRPILL